MSAILGKTLISTSAAPASSTICLAVDFLKTHVFGRRAVCSRRGQEPPTRCSKSRGTSAENKGVPERAFMKFRGPQALTDTNVNQALFTTRAASKRKEPR